MTQKKLNLYSIKRSFIATVLLTGALLSCILASPAKVSAHHAADCSDVYTPLSSFVLSGVANNKGAYVQVMNETGVPWEMLAAIHYRETNFSRTNPNNGQGIFQFVNGDGGPYPPGPVSDGEFNRQLRFMANKLQDDYVSRGSVPRERRKLVANEPNIAIVKDTLFSYNGRASAYINQAAHFGYNTTTQPYEGSPYVMNRFDCPRARMGIITKDYATGISGSDTRYGAFTVYARLKGDDYWRALTLPYAWQIVSQSSFSDSSLATPIDTNTIRAGQRTYTIIRARNIGNTTWSNSGANPVRVGTANPGDRKSIFCDSTWIACNRPTTLIESSVAPGSIGTFGFWMKAPSGLGNYNEYFNLLAEGKGWMNDFGMYYPMGVKGDTYTWQFSGQAIYTDSARTKQVDFGALSPNTTYYIKIRAKNTGNTVWQKNQLNLGTSYPPDRISRLKDGSWMSANRAATIKEASVGPGEMATFEFSLKTPAQTGAYDEHFRPVAEGKSWLNDLGLYLPLRVQPSTYRAAFVGQAVYTNEQKTQTANISSTANNNRLFAVLRLKNIGNTTWYNTGPNPLHLGTNVPIDRSSSFKDSSWISANRAARLKQSSVAPGEEGTFEFWIKAPYALNGTQFKEYFRPVAEGKSWLNDLGQFYQFTMSTGQYLWSYEGQALYSNAARTSTVSGSLNPNTTYYLRLRAKNVGGNNWAQGVVNLATSSPSDRTSQFNNSSWVSTNRAATISPALVKPGELGVFDFSVTTLPGSGNYKEYFRPVADGYAWFEDRGVYWQLNIE